MSQKEELRYPNLREAMVAVQDLRAREVGEHTWKKLVEHYGEAILFAEIATIVSRLEQIIWHANPWESPEKYADRELDLLIDLGNYAEFLYMTVVDRSPRQISNPARVAEIEEVE